MDAATALIIGGTIAGTTSIVAAAVPQIIQALRARSDYGHELRRDHAQRMFEYDKFKFERIRSACVKMLTLMNDYQELCRESLDLEAEWAGLLPQFEVLDSVAREAERGASRESRECCPRNPIIESQVACHS